MFLKTSEEAVCSTGTDCKFSWTDDSTLPTLTSFAVAFNTDINDYQLTLTGTGFPTEASDVTLMIDGTAQTVVSSSETSIVVTITSMLSSTSKNIAFYLPSGTPKGAD